MFRQSNWTNEQGVDRFAVTQKIDRFAVTQKIDRFAVTQRVDRGVYPDLSRLGRDEIGAVTQKADCFAITSGKEEDECPVHQWPNHWN